MPASPGIDIPRPTAFKDAAGHTWNIALTIAAVKRVRELTGVDLGKVFSQGPEGEAVRNQLQDIVTVADVLFAIVKPQADQAGVTDEQFGERLIGDVLADAHDALIEGLLSFQTSRDARAALRQVITAQKRLAETQLAAAVARVQAATSGPSSTSSPASSESTPDPSRSGS